MPVLEYFNRKKAKEENIAKSPILNDEDEKFLNRITSEDQPPPLPERPVVILDNGKKVKGKDAQKALMDGADTVPLPTSPPTEGEGTVGGSKAEEKKGHDYWAYIRNVPNQLPFSKNKAKEHNANDLAAAAETLKQPDPESSEAKKEEDELTCVLDQLNLSAVNNRVFSFSKESTKLMEEFTLILKDIVNGAPTAYDDLEKLLTRQESQLTKMFGAMPPFLQTLVKSLPAKFTATLGPEFLAATSEKPGADAKMMNAAGKQPSATGSGGKKKKSRIPSLKSLVSQQGAVAAMLRSILNFLKLRFPAFMTGTNVLMSLAVFLLLFVFWYCHKRGKETRLEKERLAAEGASDLDNSASDLEESEIAEKHVDDVEPPIKLGTVPSVEEKPSAAVEDLSSILNQQTLSEVPLPEPRGERELATPVGLKK